MRLLARGKPSHKVVVAIARELTGFVWDVLAQYPQQHLGAKRAS
jgi:hypothetical protein